MSRPIKKGAEPNEKTEDVNPAGLENAKKSKRPSAISVMIPAAAGAFFGALFPYSIWIAPPVFIIMISAAAGACSGVLIKDELMGYNEYELMGYTVPSRKDQ